VSRVLVDTGKQQVHLLGRQILRGVLGGARRR
jgi:hypothetical protein